MKRHSQPRVRLLLVVGLLLALVSSLGGMATGPAASAHAMAALRPCVPDLVQGGYDCDTVVSAPRPVTTSLPDPLLTGTKVDVGGYRLYIRCWGTGSQTVVFDSGYGGDISAWIDLIYAAGLVLPDVRFCAYNRAGLGAGSARSGPRPKGVAPTGLVAARELRALLASARVPGPYILVGHSIGGANILLYTYTYPQDVEGLVLVDSSQQNQCRVLKKLSPCASTGDTDIKATFAELRAANHGVLQGSLGALPLVVLTAGRHGDTADVQNYIQPRWERMQNALASMSSNSIHVLARTSGHFIQMDDQGLVVAAIKQMVRASRTPSRLLTACGRGLEKWSAQCLPAGAAVGPAGAPASATPPIVLQPCPDSSPMRLSRSPRVRSMVPVRPCAPSGA